MDVFTTIFTIFTTTTGVISGSTTSANFVVPWLRHWSRERKATQIAAFIHQLGLKTEGDIKTAVGTWEMPKGFTETHRAEMVVLLTNLTRGARFHSTQGTPLSAYLRCERLIEQLIQNIQPKHRGGAKINDWELKRFLGMGSFGEVWMAVNPHHPDKRAFKFFTQPDARDWLDREGETLGAVLRRLRDCPNVIRYVDFYGAAQPYPYLVVEYVAGGSLEDWILSPFERVKLDVSEFMVGLVRGVAEAHKHGIYHRDLKPANVLLSDDAEPIAKIADFGLSRVDERAENQSSFASKAVLVGTRMYHPPEASDPFANRDPAQDDVFALGLIWYQVLTGKLERPPYDFAEQLRNEGVDSRTIRMVSRCLAHPNGRYKTAGELHGDLDAETPPEVWSVPEGCFDVAPIAREFMERSMS